MGREHRDARSACVIDSGNGDARAASQRKSSDEQRVVVVEFTLTSQPPLPKATAGGNTLGARRGRVRSLASFARRKCVLSRPRRGG
jgi:hypothetical protein